MVLHVSILSCGSSAASQAWILSSSRAKSPYNVDSQNAGVKCETITAWCAAWPTLPRRCC